MQTTRAETTREDGRKGRTTQNEPTSPYAEFLVVGAVAYIDTLAWFRLRH